MYEHKQRDDDKNTYEDTKECSALKYGIDYDRT
jgi:hypothetical protein